MPPAPSSDEPFAYLTTTGRRSGRAHRIEIWFAADGATLYLLAGGGRRSDWVANAIATPEVQVEVGGHAWGARARVVGEPAEEERARQLVFEKYQPTYDGDLSGWRETALPIALDLADAP